jgi:hypothetical protein
MDALSEKHLFIIRKTGSPNRKDKLTRRPARG